MPESAAARVPVWKSLLTMLRQWWDNDYLPGGAEQARKMPDVVDWRRCVPFVLLHAGCLGVVWVGASWFAVLAALVLYVVRMFAITAFYHRYFSHRTFRTSRAAQFVFAVLGETAMQRGPLWWAAHHRHHHQHSDEEPDSHSPILRGFLWSHIGWITSPRNFPTDYSRVRDFVKQPEIMFLNRHDMIVPILYGAFLWLVGEMLGRHFPHLGTNGAQLVVWGFFISTVAVMHATFCINSLAHIFGKRRFDTEDMSRNSWILALVTLGEGWHNNHHRYMHSARQGFRWWEIDVCYYGLRVLSWCGIIWDLKQVPEEIYMEMRNPKQANRAVEK